MPRKKTKEQKKKSAERRHSSLIPAESAKTMGASPDGVTTQVSSSSSSRSPSVSDTERILGYPIRLLYKDLIKSAIITTVLFAVLVGIYVYIQYNGVSLI